MSGNKGKELVGREGGDCRQRVERSEWQSSKCRWEKGKINEGRECKRER